MGERPAIYVLAGTNGAGKSSVAGEAFRARGADYFNPDEAARRIRQRNPAISQADANGAAWMEGKRLLERAIAGKLDFAFESTLGGNTIPALLKAAIAQGFEVRIWFVGLATPELHLARIRARVAVGGHDIPEADVRRRFDAARRQLVTLLPGLTELRVYDNSAEADPHAGKAPSPRLVLHLVQGRVLAPADLSGTPDWAKPIVAAALRLRKKSLPGP